MEHSADELTELLKQFGAAELASDRNFPKVVGKFTHDPAMNSVQALKNAVDGVLVDAFRASKRFGVGESLIVAQLDLHPSYNELYEKLINELLKRPNITEGQA